MPGRDCALADSKTLNEEKRDRLFEVIKKTDYIGWMVVSLSAAELSNKMLQKCCNPLLPFLENAHVARAHCSLASILTRVRRHHAETSTTSMPSATTRPWR